MRGVAPEEFVEDCENYVHHDDEALWNTIQAHLDANPDLARASNDEGMTPLHIAARYGDFRLMSEVLDHGADADIQDNAGWTPLHYLAWVGNSKLMAEVLLKQGADVNATEDNGDTPLHCAAARNNEDLADSLINKEAVRDIENEDGNAPIDPAHMHSANRVYNLLKERDAVNGD